MTLPNPHYYMNDVFCDTHEKEMIGEQHLF